MLLYTLNGACVCPHRTKSKFGDEEFRFFGFLVFTQCIVNATVAGLGERERMCVYAAIAMHPPPPPPPHATLTTTTLIDTVVTETVNYTLVFSCTALPEVSLLAITWLCVTVACTCHYNLRRHAIDSHPPHMHTHTRTHTDTHTCTHTHT